MNLKIIHKMEINIIISFKDLEINSVQYLGLKMKNRYVFEIDKMPDNV